MKARDTRNEHRDTSTRAVAAAAIGLSVISGLAVAFGNTSKATEKTIALPQRYAAETGRITLDAVTQQEGVSFTLENFLVHVQMPQDLESPSSN